MGHHTTFFLYLTTSPSSWFRISHFLPLGGWQVCSCLCSKEGKKIEGVVLIWVSVSNPQWLNYVQTLVDIFPDIFLNFFAIILQVDECLDNFNFDLAVKFCEKALGIEPDNVEVLEVAGAVYLETGETDKAKTVSLC